MRVIRLAGTIGPDRKLHLQLPDDVAEGPAEVIVSIPEPGTPSDGVSDFGKFLDFVDSLPPGNRSKEEIDRALQAERDSWEKP